VKPTLVGVCGYAQVGKDTTANYLHDKYGYHHAAFANSLRLLALEVNPTLKAAHPELLITYRAAQRRYGYEGAKREVPGYRDFLKALGNGVRKVLGADTWVKATLLDCSDYTVISDVRFLNEADAIRRRAAEMGGTAIIIRVTRPDHGPESSFEEEVPFIEADFVLENDGDVPSLHRKVDAAIEASAKPWAQGRLF
jgi:hypothetical protein